GATDESALGTDRREVVAHPAAAAHRLRRLGERRVDARLAVDHLGDRIAHALHEAIDERRSERRAGRGIDATGGNEAALLRLEELRFPVRPLPFGLGGRQRARNARPDFGYGSLAVLRVVL